MAETTGLIEQYAQHLERRASALVLRFTALGALAGAMLGGFPLFQSASNAIVPHNLGYATLLLGAAAGGYLGWSFGERRAVELRFQAQIALRQLQVEQALMRQVAARPAPAPAPQPARVAPLQPVAQPAPAPARVPVPPAAQPAPVAVAPPAPAPVAPPVARPVAPPVVQVAPTPPPVGEVAPAPAPAPAPTPTPTPAPEPAEELPPAALAPPPRLVQPPLSSTGA